MTCEFRRRHPEQAGVATGRLIDLVHHQIINHKALETLPMATTRPSYTKLTCPSPTTTGARGPRFHTNRRRGFDIPETSSLAKPNGRSTSCAFAFPYHYNYTYYIVATERNDDKPTVSLCTDDNGTPAIWTLILSSSKSSTGRTGQVEGRFNYWNYMETSLQPGIQEYSTGQGLIASRRHAL